MRVVLGVRAVDLSRLIAGLPAESGAAVLRHGPETVIGLDPDAVVRIPAGGGGDPFATLDALPPGWWAGFLSYEAGAHVEHTAGAPVDLRSAAAPELLLGRFDARLVIDADGRARIEGDGRGRDALERLLRDGPPPGDHDTLADLVESTPWESDLGRDAWCDGVATVLDLIRAGDVYQVNLTRRLRTTAPVDAVALAAAITRRHPAPHRGLFTIGDVAVVSASPERFLSWDGAAVETRPIKGTGRNAAALLASAKDHAENIMITDLARNDLGRVCVPGSVTVPSLCALEPHPGLVHLASTVHGRRRPDVTTGDLLRAAYPPASITGAPKPRVMQAIADLESSPRGVYCGAFGWIDTAHDRGDLAVAIRSFATVDGVTTFGVGAGITIDSDPAAEWAETELKARRLLALADGVTSGAP